jgi:anti-sigma regulatory factor (Ser/Thr protein kinase)
LIQLDLTFERLDDLALAVERKKIPADETIVIREIQNYGPLIEFAFDWLESSPRFSAVEIPSSRELDALSLAIRDRVATGDSYGSEFGFYPTLLTESEQSEDDRWLGWRYRAQTSAERAGFSKSVAQGLIGAIDELKSNIYEHSEHAETGLIAYHRIADAFEFVIADRGIGVLKSLSASPEFSPLTDSGTALELALREGYSRFGINVGRGMGFRQLFSALARLNGFLRFRSGDYALLMKGRATRLDQALVVQKATFVGFSISILCRSAP